jgi:hypothetical protein
MITMLGAKQGLPEADTQKLFDGLSGVDQVAISVHNDRMVAMITGSVADSGLPAPEAGLKAMPVSGGVMLIGHAGAVDQAMQRIAMKGPATALTRSTSEHPWKPTKCSRSSARLPGVLWARDWRLWLRRPAIFLCATTLSPSRPNRSFTG